MLTKQERDHIVERINFEQDVKKSLALDDTPKPSRIAKAWEAVNSGLILLIAGSIVSVLIIPRLQASQQEKEWQRQVKADYVKFNLGMMRDCYQHFNTTASILSEAVEIGKQIDSPDVLSTADYKIFRSQLIDIVHRSVESSAKALSLTIAFPSQSLTRQTILEYDVEVQRYIDTIDRLLEIKYQFSGATGENADRLAVRLHRLSAYSQDLQNVNHAYDVCAQNMSHQLMDQETNFENFNFAPVH